MTTKLHSPSWAKSAVFDYLDWLESLIKGLLASNDVQLSTAEKEHLEEALEMLRPAVNLLAERFLEPMRASDPGVTDAGYRALLEAMEATQMAASEALIRRTLSGPLIPIMERETINLGAERLRQRKTSLVSARRAAVAAAMRKVRTNPAISIEYARRLQPLVIEELARSEEAGRKKGTKNTLSPWTIRSYVRAILEETPGKSGKS